MTKRKESGNREMRWREEEKDERDERSLQGTEKDEHKTEREIERRKIRTYIRESQKREHT